MRYGTQMALGSLAGVLAAGLAVVLFFVFSNFIVMFVATPCVLGLAGVPAGYLAARAGSQAMRGGALTGGIGLLVVGAAALLATLVFGAAGFLGGGFEREGDTMMVAMSAVCGGGLVAGLIGVALAAAGGAIGGLLAGKK